MQQELEKIDAASLRDELLDGLLTSPVVEQALWSDDELKAEVENNGQGILGYVVHWVDQGVVVPRFPIFTTSA